LVVIIKEWGCFARQKRFLTQSRKVRKGKLKYRLKTKGKSAYSREDAKSAGKKGKKIEDLGFEIVDVCLYSEFFTL
jgi:hypothetical protein